MIMPNIINDNKYLKKVVNGITTNYVKCLKYESPQSMYFYIQDTSGNANALTFNTYGNYTGMLSYRDVYYSYDLSQWQVTTVTPTGHVSINIPANGRVYLKCQTDYWGREYKQYFTYSMSFCINCNDFCDVGGNIMSLLYGDNFVNQYTIPTDLCFYALFYNNNKIINAKDLCLPATTLTRSCYTTMFEGCSSLITAPTLPATTLTSNCYTHFFYNCSSLISAPALPATTLANSCYYSMFYNCSSLISAPALPATTLEENCYTFMFGRCTTLTTAPALPATTLAQNCYNNMFRYCSNLNSITVGATSWDTSKSSDWVYGVSATGTFTKPSGTTIPEGTYGIPSGWTVVNV